MPDAGDVFEIEEDRRFLDLVPFRGQARAKSADNFATSGSTGPSPNFGDMQMRGRSTTHERRAS